MLCLRVVALQGFLLCLTALSNAEVQKIKEISSGPFQKYSAQPLVNIGDGFYYVEVNVKASWYGASEFCRNVGLHLASLETEEENNAVTDYIETIGFQDFWLSGTDLNEVGNFIWFSTGAAFTFTDWHTGQPSNTLGNEHCVHFWFHNGYLKWNDDNCGTKRHFICERICDQGCTLALL